MVRTARLSRVAALLLLIGAAVTLAAPTLRPFGSGWSVLGLALLAVAAFVLSRRLARRIPRGTVVEVDLTGGVGETPPSGPMAKFRPDGPACVRDVVDSFRRAAGDRRVEAMFVRLSAGGIGPAAVEEIRAAVRTFRSTGRKAVAFAETLGEGGNGTLAVWLAAAFDEVWIQPMGDVSFVGIESRQPFLRGLFDRLGILPRFDHRKEYKAAKYTFTESSMPAPQREETERLLDSIMGEIVAGVAADRGMAEDSVRDLLSRGPLLAKEAVEGGLVDGLRYRDEVVDALTGGRKSRFLYSRHYLRRAGRPERKGAVLALVTAAGAIERGRGRFRLLPMGRSMGADDVAEAIRAAREAKRVKAILMRVESPGGSAVASETIRREVEKTIEAGKPVVVSMGNVAGSGGYWISMTATKIVARPSTITGSIGVVSGKFVTSGAFEKAGIRFEGVERGERAGIWSSSRDFTEAEWERLQAFLDDVYEEFKSRVAKARSMSREAVEEVAKGRVWTGRDARERGLVDVLGGFGEAIDVAREAAGIAPQAPVRIVSYPKRGPIARLFSRRKSSEDVTAAVFSLLTAGDGPVFGGAVRMTLPQIRG